MRAEIIMCFCIKKYIGTQDEDCILNTSVVYANDRSMAVVLR